MSAPRHPSPESPIGFFRHLRGLSAGTLLEMHTHTADYAEMLLLLAREAIEREAGNKGDGTA